MALVIAAGIERLPSQSASLGVVVAIARNCRPKFAKELIRANP